MILLTGVSGGIGNYLHACYQQKKEDLLGTYHLNKPVEENFCDTIQLDITDTSAISDFVKKHNHQLKNITLINCAGISYNSFAHAADLKSWSDVIHVNLTGTFFLIHAILPLMRAHGFGRIINLSSIVGQMGVMGTSAYAASKAGLNGMIKSIALENALKNITINNINLGYFNVGMIHTVPVEFQDTIKQKIGTKDFGDPVNIFNTIEYIRNTPYLTGSCIDLNGGLV